MKKNFFFIFFIVLMLSAIDVIAQGKYGNTLGAKIFISKNVPFEFLPETYHGEESCIVPSIDSVSYCKSTGTLNYEQIICIKSDCNWATIYLWDDKRLEIWERPIFDDEKTVFLFTMENGQANLRQEPYFKPDKRLKYSLLSRLENQPITLSSEKIEVTVQEQKKFMSLKRKLKI